MANKTLYIVIILALAVIVVADVLFMLQGFVPFELGPPADEEVEREPVTGATIGKNLELLENVLGDATDVLEGIAEELQ